MLVPAPRPSCSVPTEPCLACFQQTHTTTTTCDPITAALGIWARRNDARLADEIDELKQERLTRE